MQRTRYGDGELLNALFVLVHTTSGTVVKNRRSASEVWVDHAEVERAILLRGGWSGSSTPSAEHSGPGLVVSGASLAPGGSWSCTLLMEPSTSVGMHAIGLDAPPSRFAQVLSGVILVRELIADGTLDGDLSAISALNRAIEGRDRVLLHPLPMLHLWAWGEYMRLLGR
jgi:hypothetical protein